MCQGRADKQPSWRALPQSSTFQIPLRIWAPMLSLSSSQGDMIFFVCRKSSLFLSKRKIWTVLPSENCSKKLLSLLSHFPMAPPLNFTWISFIVLDGLARNYYWKGINCMSCLEICFVFVAVLILAASEKTADPCSCPWHRGGLLSANCYSISFSQGRKMEPDRLLAGHDFLTRQPIPTI